jgi:integrase
MALYKRSNSKFWWMKFTFDGELVQQSTKVANKRDALTIEAAFRHELALGRIGIKPKKDAPTFAVAAFDFLKWSKVSHAEKTTERRERFAVQVLTDFFGKKKTDSIEAKDVEKFVVWRSGQTSRKTKDKITRGTVNRELITLKKIFKRLVNEGVLRNNPAQTVKLLKENDADFHVLSDDEEKIYLLAAPQPLQDVAILMLETGMRCGEIYRIRRSEVFLDKGLLKVTKGKTKAAVRQVHLTAKASAVLRGRLQRFKGENLFPQNDEDFRAATIGIEKMHSRTLERLKLSFRLYDCRHSFASRAVENGVDLLTLSQILGHSGLKTISRYAHPSESYKADAIKKMENRKIAKAG